MDKSWLLTWNPKKWAWEESGLYNPNELLLEIKQIGFAFDKWSCGNNKSIKPGDHIFLIRLGEEPRGIVGYGIALSDVFSGTHWDSNLPTKLVHRVYVKFLRIYEPEKGPMISLQNLCDISQSFHWSSQCSGIEIPQEISIELLQLLDIS